MKRRRTRLLVVVVVVVVVVVTIPFLLRDQGSDEQQLSQELAAIWEVGLEEGT